MVSHGEMERKKKGNSLYTPSKKQRTPQGESECGEGTQRKRGIRKNVGVKKRGWRAPEKTEYRCMMYADPVRSTRGCVERPVKGCSPPNKVSISPPEDAALRMT